MIDLAFATAAECEYLVDLGRMAACWPLHKLYIGVAENFMPRKNF
jgi:hypothetical protein